MTRRKSTKDVIDESKRYEVLPVRNSVLFPGVLMPVAVTRKTSRKLVQAANDTERYIIVLTQKDSSVSEPSGKDLYSLAHSSAV